MFCDCTPVTSTLHIISKKETNIIWLKCICYCHYTTILLHHMYVRACYTTSQIIRIIYTMSEKRFKQSFRSYWKKTCLQSNIGGKSNILTELINITWNSYFWNSLPYLLQILVLYFKKSFEHPRVVPRCISDNYSEFARVIKQISLRLLAWKLIRTPVCNFIGWGNTWICRIASSA